MCRVVQGCAEGCGRPHRAFRSGNPLQRPPLAECMQSTCGSSTAGVVAHIANFFRETNARNASAGRELLHAALGHGERSGSQLLSQ